LREEDIVGDGGWVNEGNEMIFIAVVRRQRQDFVVFYTNRFMLAAFRKCRAFAKSMTLPCNVSTIPR
jgi:hypothetical protein